MKRIQPRFYRDFHCIASRCTDSCCIGWEIDVDEESLEAYDAATGEFGEKLRENIARGEESAHFVLGDRERCPFLNERNLCEIYIRLGEECLCEICREHPRFYEWFGDRVEAGLGLCCEEVCRLLLRKEEPLRFEEVQTDVPDEDFDGDEVLLTRLQPVRQSVYALLQNRSRPFWARIAELTPILASVQDELDGFPPMEASKPAPAPTDAQLLALCRAMEPIDEGWTRLVERMEAQGTPVDAPDWVYEHTAVYLTYRWLLKAAFDGDVLGKGKLIVAFVYILRLMLMRGAVDAPAEALRLLSKEIEYSQENTEFVQGWDWEEAREEGAD